jgi:hypothetical protein
MNKKVIIISSLAIVGVGVFFLLKPKKNVVIKEAETDTAIDTVNAPVNAPPMVQPSNVINRKKVLSLGSKGAEVSELQKKLGGLTVDGSFGLKTSSKIYTTFSLNKITLEQLDQWLPKVQYVQTIYPNLSSSFTRTGLYPLDLSFLKAWALAVTKKEPFFKYQTSSGEKTYSSTTGKAQQESTTLGGLITYF